MLTKKILFLFLFCFPMLTSAETTAIKTADCCGDGGIIYGDKWAFIVGAPKNWIMSTDSQSLGVNVAFFENKPLPKETDAWMYITVNSKSAHNGSLNDFITDDENKSKAESANLKISPTTLSTKKPLLVQQFNYSGENGRNELVAYQEYEDWIFTIVISANSKADLLAYQPAFIELLDSFHPMRKSN